MHLTYELGEEDLRDVQAQLLLLQRERLRRSPRLVALLVVLVAPFAWLLRASFWRDPAVLEGSLPGVLELAFVLLCAGAAVYLLMLLLPRGPSFRKLDAWSAERMARRAAQRSTFGPVSLTLGEAELVRQNASGELRLAWPRVKGLLCSARLLTLRIDDGRQVLLLPARAFADAAAFDAARARVEQLAGLSSLPVDLERGTCTLPAASRRRVHPALPVALGLALLALARDRARAWYYDPRASNPEGHVIVYGTAWCPVCAQLRACLQRAQVPFEERDVDLSARAQAEWAQLDGSGVPVTLVGQEVLHGLNPPLLQRALARAGHPAPDCGARAQAPSAVP